MTNSFYPRTSENSGPPISFHLAWPSYRNRSVTNCPKRIKSFRCFIFLFVTKWNVFASGHRWNSVVLARTGCHEGPSCSRCRQTAWRWRIPVKAAARVDYSRRAWTLRAACITRFAPHHTAVLSYTRLLSFLNCEQKDAALFSSRGPDVCDAASRCTVYLSFVFFFSTIDEHLPDVREANESTCWVSCRISPFAIFGNFWGAVEFSWKTNTAIRIWFRFGSLERCRLESFVVRRVVGSRKRSVI